MRFAFTKFIPLAVDILATKAARAEKPLKIERWSP
jgi:hypothetical protein